MSGTLGNVLSLTTNITTTFYLCKVLNWKRRLIYDAFVMCWTVFVTTGSLTPPNEAETSQWFIAVKASGTEAEMLTTLSCLIALQVYV